VFDSGAAVILEGPCKFTPLGENAGKCEIGKLAANVPPQAVGFRVDTPFAVVTDLGTEFGLLVGDEATDVAVYQGEVRMEVARSGSPARSLRLAAGASARAIHTGELQAYSDAIPRLAVVREMPQHGDSLRDDLTAWKPDFAGTNAIWGGQLSGDLRQDKRDADALQVFLERRDLVLPQDVPVDFNRDHAWDPQAPGGRYQVAAREQVDVYLLHFDLINGHQEPEQFIIDFGRPILGVIVSQATLDNTDALLGEAGVEYPEFSSMQDLRGLNCRKVDPGSDLAAIEFKNDLATVSPDGAALKLRLWGGEPNTHAKMDQVRVVVSAATDVPDTHSGAANRVKRQHLRAAPEITFSPY
jgi:hypothetical protein